MTRLKSFNKKKLSLWLSLAFVLVLVGGVQVYAQTRNTNKSSTQLAQEVTDSNKLSLTDRVGIIFNRRRVKNEITQEEVNQVAHKDGVLRAEARITKRDILSKAIENVNGDYILVSNDTFRVAYAPSPDSFFVYLAKPVSTTRTQAEKWFTDRGFTRSDLCSLGIHFVPNFENPTRNDRNTTNRTIAGC